MNEALLLDTHIVLWLETGDGRLRPETRAMIDACWTGGGTIHVCAVTAWEIALLVDVGRIELDLPAPAWMARFLARPGVVEQPMGWRVATGAYALDGLDHHDPADRMLIATAIALGCPLVTYDERFIAFAARDGRRQGFTVASDVTSPGPQRGGATVSASNRTV